MTDSFLTGYLFGIFIGVAAGFILFRR